jgi:hypothetical protein
MIANRYFNLDPKESILIIAILLLIALLIDTCDRNYQLNEDIKYLNNELDDYSDLNSKYVKTIYNDSLIIYSQKQNIISKELANSIIEKKYNQLLATNNKNINEIIDLKTRIKLKFKTELINADVDSSNGFDYKIKLPKDFFKEDKWYSISGNINRLGYLQIDSLSLNSGIIFIQSDTLRKGLINKILNKKDNVIRVNIDNPYVNISSLSNIYINKQKQNKRAIYIALSIGALLGYVVASK